MDSNCSLEASQNKIVSSTNNKWEICTPTAFTPPTWNPRIRLHSSAFFKSLLRTSIIKRNNSGDSGSPCLHPREHPKKPSGDPFTRTEKRIDSPPKTYNTFEVFSFNLYLNFKKTLHLHSKDTFNFT